MFKEWGQGDAVIQAKVQQAWNKLFNGDSQNERVYYEVGNDMAYILDVGDNDVRSEGMSYGLMICVQLDHQLEFDKLYKWAVTYMRHNDPTDARYGYFAWHCNSQGDKMDQNSASDGETYFATALFFAAGRWKKSQNFDYMKEANFVVQSMLDKEITGIKDSVTNMFNANSQVVFTPYASAATYTDPSYHLPSFYELWARWASQNNSFWQKTIPVARSYFLKAANPSTALMPNYSDFDGKPYGSGQTFSFDAWRCAQNWAIDYAWFAADKQQINLSNTLLEFFFSQGVDTYGNQYTLAGQKTSGDHSPGLVAMNAVAGLSATTNKTWDFIAALWNLPVPSGHWRYYDGMLYFLGLLHISGNYKIYAPAQEQLFHQDSK